MLVKERPPALARLAWWWLRRAGWVQQVNTPDACHDYGEHDGQTFDRGWQPLHAVRYGHVPVYLFRSEWKP